MLSLIGLSVFFATFGGMLWANARRWRYLAITYAEPIGHPIAKRSFQSGVLLGLGGFNSLKGILTIGVHESGVSLRVMPLFALFHEPLFIPYSDIQGWETTWYLDAPSTELEFRGAPEVKLVVPAEQAEWIQSFAGQAMTLREVTPPNGKAGRGWHVFALVHAGMSIVMLAWLAGVYLSR